MSETHISCASGYTNKCQHIHNNSRARIKPSRVMMYEKKKSKYTHLAR